ncbi:hypothetical protein BYT27DRAFT_7150508 [Phlegmacium glaucopus]|nr:hypothetical protein BYT27DRAFT_7150508 [Phlegmacium glaucopus]
MTTVSLLVDDQDSQIQYLCPSLHQTVTGSYYNNTWSTVENDSCSNGWFQYTFNGVGVQVSVSLANAGQSYQVKLDDGPFVPQTGHGSFESPVLPDGKHTITYATDFSSETPPSFDYLTVTPGPSTPLSGKTLAADDTDPSFIYSGKWKITPPNPIPFDYSTSLYRNTTHWTSTIGDSLQFNFIGTSISVFGILANISSGGNISATYTIDGVSKTLGIPNGTLDTLPMVQLFHSDLQAGSHTLVVNITDIAAPRALGIDYITYNASSDTLPPAIINAAPSPASNSKKEEIGLRVGAAIGAILCLLLLSAFVAFLWRRRRLEQRQRIKLSESDL